MSKVIQHNNFANVTCKTVQRHSRCKKGTAIVFANREILGALGENRFHVAPTNGRGVNIFIVDKQIDTKNVIRFLQL